MFRTTPVLLNIFCTYLQLILEISNNYLQIFYLVDDILANHDLDLLWIETLASEDEWITMSPSTTSSGLIHIPFLFVKITLYS